VKIGLDFHLRQKRQTALISGNAPWASLNLVAAVWETTAMTTTATAATAEAGIVHPRKSESRRARAGGAEGREEKTKPSLRILPPFSSRKRVAKEENFTFPFFVRTAANEIWSEIGAQASRHRGSDGRTDGRTDGLERRASQPASATD